MICDQKVDAGIYNEVGTVGIKKSYLLMGAVHIPDFLESNSKNSWV